MCLFFPYVVKKSTAHIYTKALNICHQSQKFFWGISVGIPQHKKGYLVCVPITLKIFSSHNVVFDETFSITFSYTSHPCPEALVTLPEVSYTPCATSYHEQTSNIITFSQFEEVNLVGN